MHSVTHERPPLLSQESIDLLIRLLQELERRSGGMGNIPPEVQKDIAVVLAAFDAIKSALGLAGTPLNQGTSDNKPYPFVRAELSNKEFVSTFKELMREVWIGIRPVYGQAVLHCRQSLGSVPLISTKIDRPGLFGSVITSACGPSPAFV